MTQRKKGFSLIEVVIALAIFVIGALAILRIFPTGVGLVEKSGNTQRATNLNRSILANLKNEDALPEGVTNIIPGSAPPSWQQFNGSVIGSSKFNHSLPNGVSAGELLNSSLDRYKHIIGEKTTVRNGNGDCYVLTQFSVDPSEQVDIFKEEVLEDVTLTSTGVLDFSSATTKSGATFTAPTAPASPADNRTFYVTYRYKIGSGTAARVAGIDEEPIKAGTAGAVQVAHANPLAGNVEVRIKEPVTGGVLTPVDDAELRCGFVKLTNPLPTGQKLSIDYTTDWYWILEQLTPTNADAVFKKRVTNANGDLEPDPADTHKDNYRQVELSVPFVQGRTRQRFATLVMEKGGNGRHYSWLNDGSSVLPPASSLVKFPEQSGGGTLDNPNFRNTLREGKIGFDITDPNIATPVTPLSSPVIRVAYNSQDAWARQLSASAKSYKPYDTAVGERWRDYWWAGANELLFHPSEAGKAVKVTYRYGDPADASTDQTKTELLTIGVDIQPSTLLGSTDAVTLKIAPPTGTSVTAILSVKGASVTSRTAWLTNDRYSHNLLTSMRSDS